MVSLPENNKYKDLLAREGLKNTHQRTAILNILEKSDVPITAEEIYLKLKEAHISTCLSTVYRNLEALISRSIVTKTTIMDDDRSKFALNYKQHRHHLICLGCTKMVQIDTCPLSELEKTLHDSTGFDVTGHKLEIYGYCAECKLKQ